MPPYDLVLERISALATKIDTSIDVGKTTGEKVDVVLGDHEKRIRELEQFMWKMAATMAIVSTIAGAVASLVMHAIQTGKVGG